MKKLAIVTTHPIQYYAPVFRLLHQRKLIEIKVFYTWGEGAADKFDPGFNKNVTWDIPLLEDYPYEWAVNTSSKPGSNHFKGIVTPGLVKQVEMFKPNAVLFFGWAYQSHLKAIRYFSGKLPVYFRGDSTLLDKQAGIRAFFRPFFLKWVYRYINHAFYVGVNNKAYFKHFGVKDKQLTFAGHAVDNERFSVPADNDVKLLRDTLGLKHTDILILYAGKFEEKKNLPALIDAFKKITRPGCHLLFVGDGQLESLIREKAHSAANIHFMEFQNQSYMPVIYQACQVFCLPSKGPGETWGLAVNEAMASGKAVLVSDRAGCAADLVKDNYNGAIFTSDNEIDFSRKLDYLLKSPVMLNTYGVNSVKLIKEYNFLNIAIAIEDKITSLNN